MPVLLVDADLGQPGVDGQNLDFVPAPKLVHLPHLAPLLGGPVDVALEHVQAVRVPDVWSQGNVAVGVLTAERLSKIQRSVQHLRFTHTRGARMVGSHWRAKFSGLARQRRGRWHLPL